MTIDQLPTLPSGSGASLVPVSNNGADYKANFVELTGAGADLGAGIDISTGDDLDTYLDDGTYRCASVTVAASLSNAPTTAGGFKLYVLTQNSNYKWQIAIGNQTDSPIFKRRYTAGTWESWKKLLDETYLPLSAANGGTGVTSLGALKTALGLNFSFTAVNINANSTYLFNVGNTMRGILVTSGPSSEDKNLYVFASTSGGVTSLNAINTSGGTNIVANGGTGGNITIQNNGANQITVFTIRVSGA